jgi:hypothetical protein
VMTRIVVATQVPGMEIAVRQVLDQRVGRDLGGVHRVLNALALRAAIASPTWLWLRPAGDR